jgi:hypothetical protein
VAFGARWAVLAALFALQFPGPPQADSRSGLIVGQVIDGVSNRPVAGAVVSMSGAPGPAGRPFAVLTGADGRFVFRDMARGSYNVTATKAGFGAGAYGRRRPSGPAVPLAMADGERRDDIVLRLWKLAAISGTIIDESGERQVGVQVRAYRRAVVGGRRRFVPAGAGATDDRGVYRIGTLLPGDYIVGTASRQTSVPLSLTRDAEPSSQGAQLSAEMRGAGGALIVRDGAYVLGRGSATPPPPEGGRLAVYRPTFHPFAAVGEAASVIPLGAGQDHDGADIQLTPVTSVGVSGFIAGPDGPVTATTVRLVAITALELPSEADGLMTVTDRRGGFSFPAVPSGHYALRLARGQPAGPRRLGDDPPSIVWLDLPLSVGAEDIENLAVTAHAGLHVSGRLAFEGDPGRARGSLSRIQIAIEPADIPPDTSPSIVLTRPDQSGEFSTRQLVGGRYFVRVLDSPSGWMFKSATLEGRDLVDTPFTLTSDVANVTISFTDRWSGLRGHVQADRESNDDTLVIAFPTDMDAWSSSGRMPRRLRSARVSPASGEYAFTLPPGDYYVVAVPEEQAAGWQDAEFLAAASRFAVRVRIAEGERRVQDLRVRDVQ